MGNNCSLDCASKRKEKASPESLPIKKDFKAPDSLGSELTLSISKCKTPRIE